MPSAERTDFQAWSALQRRVLSAEEQNRLAVEGICETLFAHPELSREEFFSCGYLCDVLKKRGFSVETPVAGLPTAFRAQIGSGAPRVAFLAEYDALPGYGADGKSPAHACGHNWIAASAVGAALALADVVQTTGGTVLVLGTPAEEAGGDKAVMIREGCFDGIDAVFQMHLSGQKTQLFPRALALDGVEFSFTGRAAHAANAPQEGINALDACNLTFCGINALRQHMPKGALVHGVITDGGAAPNIVPAHAACRFYVRGNTRDEVDALTRRVVDCARGAALMTGASLEWSYFESQTDDLVNSPTLAARMARYLPLCGEAGFTDDKAVAPFGSSDIGNVSHVCPTLYVSLYAGDDDRSDIHQTAFLSHVHGEDAKKTLPVAVRAMALCALDVLTDNVKP